MKITPDAEIRFKELFGQTPLDIRKVCLLVPFLPKGALKALGIKNLNRGSLYACGSTKYFTLLCTGLGPLFLGDAVLELKQTPCEYLFLFGSCGSVQQSHNLSLGSLVMPSLAFSIESFSQILLNNFPSPLPVRSDEHLTNLFFKDCPSPKIPLVRCVSFGSLSLEEKYQDYLLHERFDVIDMECAAFFLAAQHIGRKALALFYVTDILGEKPLFKPRTAIEQRIIQKASLQGLQIIKKFAEKLSSSDILPDTILHHHL